MSVRKKLQELQKSREKAYLGGGTKRIERQHSAGKLTARERLALLLDADSFVETDPFIKNRCTDFGMSDVETPGEGVITGYGTIDGRQVFVFAQDATVLGGALGEAHSKKICKVMDLAAKAGAPFIGLNDSGGARIQEGVDALDGYGQIFYRNTVYSGVVPQISVIMGPCAGGAVYSPAITDFILMVENTSQMFITGPQVIKSITGEDVTLEELGGARTHSSKSGVAHFSAESEQDCLALVRKLLSYLPSNNMEDPPAIDYPEHQDNEINSESLLDIIPDDPNKPYDVRDIINTVSDPGSFLEVQTSYAANAVIGFARMQGRSIGIIANQPKYLAGCLDINASDKIARFIRTCDAFNVPIVTFVDVPGFLPGISQEFDGIIRHGAKVLFAYSEATVPKLAVILRKAYGGAYVAMCSRSLGADAVYAWPTAEIAVMGAQGAANIIFRDDIKNASDPEATRREKVDDYTEKFANPYVAAARGYIDDVIDPRDTRPLLIKALNMIANKNEQRPAKKHGNIPV
ncbi:MAG TPA: methylmalonyl-CoA carboxyltransferase [Firmicutes bacterium]|jgi:acetyl-CoA carboxylase carboxyltransferase component|nr:methylmalonyl-CoA carboxyltransferase [Bacillota bacterium]HAZ21222.1 methylmalonyl-CoA carboxyltransferase [Bacillota bacterium]HBG43050.1 methylmalonyl-CoA carboxyltransferase [Bacillota bacterium]HBR23922.1 methylmalonyl-CoA carboxyltransferase [Bacillota bacterium]HCT37001.1 methylmalonyl-CoA carboxyltransferase [Bacillota bacterium]